MNCQRIQKTLNSLKSHRTWIMGIVIAGAFTGRMVSLPPKYFVEVAPHLEGVLYALAIMIGVGKLGDALLWRWKMKRQSSFEEEEDPTHQVV